MNILVVDDAPVNAVVLRNILEHAEHRVLTCHSGEEALKLLDAHPEIDLLAVDIIMPGMSGLELVAEIRRREPYAHLPVIFITGVSDAAAVQAAVELESSGYILKPIVEPSRVLRLVADAGAQEGPLLEDGDLLRGRLGIDRATHQLMQEAVAREVNEALERLDQGGEPDWVRLRDTAEQVGAARLVRALGKRRGNPGADPVLLRELKALAAELSLSGVT